METERRCACQEARGAQTKRRGLYLAQKDGNVEKEEHKNLKAMRGVRGKNWMNNEDKEVPKRKKTQSVMVWISF